MATTTLALTSDAVKEEFSPTVAEALASTDAAMKQIKSSSMKVTSENLGRDYKAKHTLITSVAGAFHWSDINGSAATEDLSSAVMQTSMNTFPTVLEASNVGLTTVSLQLVEGKGNIALPRQLFSVDQLKASFLNFVATNIKQTAKMVAQTQAAAFYAATGTAGAFATVDGDPSVGGNDGDSTATLSFSSGRIGRFYPGMLVDVVNGSAVGTSRLDTGDIAVVDQVDNLAGTINLVLVGTTATFASDIADGDFVVPRESHSGTTYLGPSGIEDWLIDSGTLYDSSEGIALATYPQFKSLLGTSVGSLTDKILRNYVGQFYDAYGDWVTLDTIITTDGVTREYMDQAEDLGTYERNGKALAYEGGYDSVGFRYNGKSFNWITSRYCEPNTMYIMKLGDGNIQKYVAPQIGQTGSNSTMGGDFQFVAPLGGSKSIFANARSSSGAMGDFVEAPFFTYYELAPKVPQGIKLTGLTEATSS